MHDFDELFLGENQAEGVYFSGASSSCLETPLVSELPCARTPKRGSVQVPFPQGYTGQSQGDRAQGDPFDLLALLPLYLIIDSVGRGGRTLLYGTQNY